MIKICRISLTVSTLLLLQSCSTSLISNKVDNIDNKKIPSGLVYQLPAKKFNVKATFQISSCSAVDNKANLEAEVTASLTESLIGRESFILDYQTLNTLTKVTETEFQLSDSGLLMGVNASIVDKSGAIIQNFASTVAGVARAVAIPNVTISPNYSSFKKSLPNFSTKKDVQKLAKKQAPEYYSYTGELDVTFKELIRELGEPCAPFAAIFSEKKNLESELKTW